MPQNSSLTEGFLHAAKQNFLLHGYDGASMDKIAQAAGTTKRTLYNHVSSKDKLFEAVVVWVGDVGAANLARPETLGDDPLEAVAQFCLRQMYWSCWVDAIEMQRLVIALAPRFPRHAALFYEQTMLRAVQTLAPFIQSRFVPEIWERHGSAAQLTQHLLQAVSGERRFASLMGALAPYPAPTTQTPWANLPEEPRVRRLISDCLVPPAGNASAIIR